MQGLGAMSHVWEASLKPGAESQVTPPHRVVLADGRDPQTLRELKLSSQGHPCMTVSRMSLLDIDKSSSCVKLHVALDTSGLQPECWPHLP